MNKTVVNKTVIIGIAGGTGSGKTTLARNIAEHFGNRIALIRQDDYYKNRIDMPRVGEQVNYDHPDAFDNAHLISQLQKLALGEAIEAPVYEYKTHTRSSKTNRIEPAPVVLVEGILIFEPRELCELFDIKIFVDTDADVRLIRRIARDIEARGRTLESVVEQYLTTVKPMHDAFVEPSRRHADIIIPEGGKNPTAFGMLIDRIESLLAEPAGLK